MKTYRFKAILKNNGWEENSYISIDDYGKIISFEKNNTTFEDINGLVLPGFQNAHSHAFQYAMAGLAEIYSKKHASDDFWSWRELMYSIALQISPDDLEEIATCLYSEMLKNGYTHVAEFHYVHHDFNGKHYNNLAEMGQRLINAAKRTGIGITLIPIFYQKGGFGVLPFENQRRFISPTVDEYLQLFEQSEKCCSTYKHANIAVGIHSLRAVESKDIIKTLELLPGKYPIHIHIAEQLKEVNESKNYLGKRPVDWLYDSINVNEKFHLVHATHITEQEIEKISKSNANVVLCPSTEGNLGDGLFPFKKYQNLQGNWSIGTDSHIGLNPFEELRLLDYGQRLTSNKRNTFITENTFDSGNYAIKESVISGRKAMNNYSEEFFKVGDYFDACVLNFNHPILQSTSIDKLSSTIVYTASEKSILCTFSKGIRVNFEPKHTFVNTIKKLGIRL